MSGSFDTYAAARVAKPATASRKAAACVVAVTSFGLTATLVAADDELAMRPAHPARLCTFSGGAGVRTQEALARPTGFQNGHEPPNHAFCGSGAPVCAPVS